MSQTAVLTGVSVLVLDDRFLLADDTRRALQAAGATVLGPCPDETQALELLERRTPDCAVLDLNVAGRPRYALARTLRAKGVPLVFVSGYEPDALPPDLGAIAWLTKPADYRRLIEAVARVSAAAF